MVELSTRSSKAIKRIEEISSLASEIDEKLETATEAMEAKTNGDGPSGDGNSAYVRLKAAIKVLRDETNMMELRTGLLAHDLMSRRSRQAKFARLTQRAKEKSRATKGNLRSDSGTTFKEDQSLLDEFDA